MVFTTKVMNLKTLLFSKYKYIILTPYMEILAGISFSNYRMGKILFTQNSFGNTWINVECRVIGVEVEKWRMVMFMKNAQCPRTMTTYLTLCDHIYPHMGKGRSHIVCSY